jgi:hypothetical protein
MQFLRRAAFFIPHYFLKLPIMKQFDKFVTDKLQEIVDLQTALKLQEDKYASMLKADEPLEKLKEVFTKIKYLKVELKAKQDHALALFQSFDA